MGNHTLDAHPMRALSLSLLSPRAGLDRKPAFRRVFPALGVAVFWLVPGPGPAHSRMIKLPFRNVDSLILVEGKINGNPMLFLVDTGANRTIVSVKTYGRLPMQLHQMQRPGRGPGIVGEAVRLRVDLALANRIWVGQPVSIMNLDDLNQALGVHVDGLLGQDVLREFHTVRIDYHPRIIELEECPRRSPRLPRSSSVLCLLHYLLVSFARSITIAALPRGGRNE